MSAPAATGSDRLRYGIVGAGYFGAALARVVAALPSGVVSAVYSPSHAEAVAAEVGCVTVGSVEELVGRDDVDAVVVASPNHAHREPVLAAATNGKHVFCEKPVALCYTDCDAMVSACERAGVLFMAGHVMHFMDGVRRVRELVEAGVIGKPVLARAARTGWETGANPPSWKKSQQLSGGHLYHHIHELDVVQFLMGPAQRVTLIGGNVAHHDLRHGDEDDMLLATLEFGDNRFGMIEWGSAFRWPEHYVLVQGTVGAIRIDFQDVGVEVSTPGRREQFPLHRSAEEDAERAQEYASSTCGGGVIYGNPSMHPPGWLNGIIEREVGYFHELALGSRAPDPALMALSDGSAARASIATADALTRSLREDRKVDVAEVTAF